MTNFFTSLRGDKSFQKLLKGSVITFILKVTGLTLSYILLLIISNKYGAEGVGFFQTNFQLLTVLGTILTLGMNTSILRYVGEFNNKKDRYKLHFLRRYIKQILTPLTIVVGLIIYFGVDYIIGFNLISSNSIKALKLIAITLPFFTLNLVNIEFIRGLHRIKASELIRSVSRPFIMILGMISILNKASKVLDVIFILMVCFILNSIVSRIIVIRELKHIPSERGFFSRKEFVKTSMPMLISGLAPVLLISIPIFSLNIFASSGETGIYTILVRLASLVGIILMVVNTIIAPQLSELYWKGEMINLQKLISQSTILMFVLAFTITLGLVFSGKVVLNFFGDEFSQGYLGLLILSFGQLINAATGPVFLLMNMTGFQKYLGKITLVIIFTSLCSNIALGYFSLSNFLNVAISSALINTISNIYLCLKFKKLTKLKSYLYLKSLR